MNLSFPERIRVDAIIQAAMDMEAAPLLHALTPIGDDETPQALLAGTHKTQRYALGELDGKTVLVVTSGIGLANAASATARALTLVDAPIVIAAGTTGGLARDINVGDIAAGPSGLDLIGAPYIETDPDVCRAFRPKSAVRPAPAPAKIL